MNRRLSIFVVIASLAICLASLAFWLTTPTRHLFILFTTGDSAWTIDTAIGRLRVQHWPSFTPAARFSFEKRYEPSYVSSALGPPPGPSAADVFVEGFRVPRTDRNPVTGRWGFSLPFGYPLLAGAIAPTWWLIAGARRRRRQHLRDQNICEQCGYDLRASPLRCPECGLERIAASTRDSENVTT